jgi:hypothetical protein
MVTQFTLSTLSDTEAFCSIALVEVALMTLAIVNEVVTHPVQEYD